MLIFDQNDLRVKRQTAHIQIGQANRYYSEYSAIIHFVFQTLTQSGNNTRVSCSFSCILRVQRIGHHQRLLH